MRWALVTLAVVLVAALALSTLGSGSSAPEPSAEVAPPVRPPARPPTSAATPCDPAEAPAMRARAEALGGTGEILRDDRLRVLPRSHLPRSLQGVRYTFATSAEGERAGVQVAGVDPGSVASELGLRVNDVVAEVDGRPLRTFDDLRAAASDVVDDGVACVRVWRRGRWLERWLVLQPEEA